MGRKKIATLAILAIFGFFLFPLVSLVPPIGIFFLLIVLYTFFLLPFVWIVYIGLGLILEKHKRRFIPLIIALGIVFSFKLGILWLSWFLLFIFTIMAILLTLKWYKENKNSALKALLAFFGLILICNLFSTLNPFASVFGFFGTGRLITLNLKQGNPCNICQEEKWNCRQFSAEAVEEICNDFDNIKSCYCCECIRNFKFCKDCFLFWNNNYRCDFVTGKCAVGW